MQTNKIDDNVKRELKQWLENANHSEAGAGGAVQDLAWLEKNNDLSSVYLGSTEKTPRANSTRPSQGGGGSSGAGTWFTSCVSKRK
jgi:hypothetical protein